ncbi:MAG TPA: tetratricopeptide repeat protein [Verrucomicrobiae bacterium]
MVRLCTLTIALSILLVRGLLAAEPEEDAFQAAAAALRDKFYERAEDQFGAFALKYPGSTNLTRAILFQAQARHFQKKHDAAVSLLQTHLPKAGALADQFLLMLGEALSAKGDHAGASEQYAKLFNEHASSPLRLQAGYLYASSLYEQRKLDAAIDFLGKADGEFRKLADAAPQDRFSFASRLLLADAQLASGKASDAVATAAAIAPAEDKPEWHWERLDLLARAELARTNTAAALAHLTNAVAVAQKAQRPRLQAQSWNLEAELYRKVGRTTNAVSAYEKIAGLEGLPIDQRRLAVLKTVELLSANGALTNAIQRLETYLVGATNEPAADLLKVKAAELWIDQARSVGGAASLATNALAQARAHLSVVIGQFTNSAHLGRAWLNRGWTFWEEGTLLDQIGFIREAESAFREASEKLTRSDDQALAIFKMADAQVRLNEPAAARTNYTRVLKDFTDLPQVRNALYDKTYAQLIRASIELKDFSGAEIYLRDLREAFPNSPTTEEAMFSFGNALMTKGEIAKARAVYQEFANFYPSSRLQGEVRFAEARTHAIEGDFAGAVTKHETWLQVFANHPLKAEVEFQRGVLLDKAGRSTNALTVFTNFVAQFPAHTLAPAAQTWVADYYHAQELWPFAEQNYQRVFQNTNWAGSSLAYYSRMMAARTAFRREGYNDGKSYLTNLLNDPKCPADLKPEAWFALGDIFLEEPITGSTNALHNFTQAAAVFDRIVTQYATNEIAMLALAKKGDCYFQMASHTNYVDSYTIASNAYGTVLSSPSKLSTKARNQAEFGLGRVLEKVAENKPDAERTRLKKAALDHYLNIVYGAAEDGSKSDLFYLKLAGREAGRLAEELGEVEAAVGLYKRLSKEVPASRSLWESRLSLLENAREAKSAVN